MSKVFQYPLGDYHICIGDHSINSPPAIYVPIPAAGYIKKITLVATVVQATATSVMTFTLGNRSLRVNGSTFQMSIPTGNTIGECYVQEFGKPSAGENRAANGAEEGDTQASDDASIFWFSGVGGGDTGRATFIVTIGRA